MSKFIIFIIISLSIYLFYRILSWIIVYSAKKHSYPVDAVHGVQLIIRIIAIFFFIITLLYSIEIPDEFLVSISSVGGLLIGFASTEIMSQVISGIYLISTQLFGVNDLIKIGDIEGIVIEIGVNYTIIQKIDKSIVKIPNKKILDSKLKNYTIKMTDELKKHNIKDKELDDIKILKGQEKSTLKSFFSKTRDYNLKKIFDDFANFMFESEITRYSFNFQLIFDIKPEIVFKKLDEICNKYESIFSYLPTYLINNMDYRVTIQLIISCIDPHQILNSHDKLMSDLVSTFYEEGEN